MNMPKKGKPVWPVAVGVISVLFGFVGVLYGWRLVAGSGAGLIGIVHSVISLALVVCGGLLLFRIKQVWMAFILWSATKIGWSLILVSYISLMVMDRRASAMENPEGLSPIIAFVAISWHALLPCVFLFWFLRRNVRLAVKGWPSRLGRSS